MNSYIIRKPVLSSIAIFFICMLARFIEYFVVRTDQTVVGENLFHKIFGILLLYVVLRILNLQWKDIGFIPSGFWKGILNGTLLGLGFFSLAYALEMIILHFQGAAPALKIFASGFSITGSQTQNIGAMFLLLSVVFNIINVWMEEGVFRGLFIKLISDKYSFARANLWSAILFGIWHLAMPLRSYVDGEMSLGTMLGMGIAYIILSGMMGIKWGLLYKMTGNLWMGLGDHLFNNVIINLLHVVSANGTDELQIVRVLTAQIISFAVVCFVYQRRKKEMK